MTADPAAVLRAAADLAEQRARAAQMEDRRWNVEGAWVVPDDTDVEVAEANPPIAEHIAATDPAFMLTRAEEWRNASAIYPDAGPIVRDVIDAIALPSALAYLRQDTP